MVAMPRSLITIDLGAIRHNVGVLRGRLESAELWAVVKADGYGHGAVDVGRTALAAGATALGVATLGEALELRRALPGGAHRPARPRWADRDRSGPRGRLELCLSAAAGAARRSRCISSSTPGWAAGASPSSPRPARASSGS